MNNLITQCNEQIYTCQTKISNIEMELNQSQKPIDNGLVKSERGIILYGPPGILFLVFEIFRYYRVILLRYREIRDHE